MQSVWTSMTISVPPLNCSSHPLRRFISCTDIHRRTEAGLVSFAPLSTHSTLSCILCKHQSTLGICSSRSYSHLSISSTQLPHLGTGLPWSPSNAATPPYCLSIWAWGELRFSRGSDVLNWVQGLHVLAARDWGLSFHSNSGLLGSMLGLLAQEEKDTSLGPYFCEVPLPLIFLNR